jgi:hypothetical protein
LFSLTILLYGIVGELFQFFFVPLLGLFKEINNSPLSLFLFVFLTFILQIASLAPQSSLLSFNFFELLPRLLRSLVLFLRHWAYSFACYLNASHSFPPSTAAAILSFRISSVPS